MPHSKLRIFLIGFAIILLFGSCTKRSEEIIPDTFVDFVINLDSPQFIDLNAIGNSVIVTSSYAGQNSGGYRGHGIIIYRASQTEFYAFDRTCTFEEGLDQAVNLNIPTDLSPICPACKSTYILPSLGYPDNDGPAIYPLRQYQTEFGGNTVWVYNFPK